MKQQDFTTTIVTNAGVKEAFEKVSQVTKWWTENLSGSSQNVDDEFTVRFDDVHLSTQRLIEVVPDKKIVWLITDSDLSFIKDRKEWNGTKIVFEFFPKGNRTEIKFTHQGLLPRVECYDACTAAWTDYIENSLKALLNDGKGKPTLKKKKTVAK